MNLNVVLWALVGLLLVAVLLGVLLRATRTRVHAHGADRTERVLPEEFAAPGERPPGFGDRLTLVQFSTEMCARCPATSRTLSAAAAGPTGVAHVEIDVTRRDDLISRFSILRTPTVLVLDAEHRVRTRVSGPVSAAQARELVATAGAADGTLERSIA